MAASRDDSDQTNVTLTISLDELFGESVPDAPFLKDAIGQEALQIIKDKSSKGRGWRGEKFKGYSKEYKNSPEFKAFGKTDTVNLRLRGDMISLMDVVETGPNTVTLGFLDEEESAKAHGHITGNVGVKRDFFGLNKTDLNKIKSKFKDDVARLKDESSRESDNIAGTNLLFLKELLNFGRGNGEG